MKTLGEIIREIREEKDLSLRELASLIGVSAPFMSDVELGRRFPSDKHMVSIAQALDTSLEELRQNDTRPPVKEFRKAAMADPAYGFAFRRMIDKKVSSSDILDFVQDIEKKRRGDTNNQP